MKLALLFSGTLVFFLTYGAAPVRAETEIWVYTSIYKEFIAPIQKEFEDAHPGYKVQIYQAGSEKIQAKLEAEITAKRPQADLLVVSDPFYAVALETRGLLEKIGPDGVRENYYSLMVLIVNRSFAIEKRPKNFSDLAKPEFKRLVQMGSPLESGTMFAFVAFLSELYGWDYFEKLRDNLIASSGGNSTVIQKVESGEKKIGIVLLENALAAKKKGSPIDVIYPGDGAVAIPSVQVLLKSSSRKDGAKKFAEFLLTKEAQKLLLTGNMYSVDPKLPPPDGAKPLSETGRGTKTWSPDKIRKTSQQAKEIKEKFAELVLE